MNGTRSPAERLERQYRLFLRAYPALAVVLTALVAFSAMLRGWPAAAAVAVLAWQAAQLRSQSLSWYLLTAAVVLTANATCLRAQRRSSSPAWLLITAAIAGVFNAAAFVPSASALTYPYRQFVVLALVLVCAVAFGRGTDSPRLRERAQPSTAMNTPRHLDQSNGARLSAG